MVADIPSMGGEDWYEAHAVGLSQGMIYVKMVMNTANLPNTGAFFLYLSPRPSDRARLAGPSPFCPEHRIDSYQAAIERERDGFIPSLLLSVKSILVGRIPPESPRKGSPLLFTVFISTPNMKCRIVALKEILL